MAGAMPLDARSPRASVPPRPVGFAAPVLVDVTPRALVVETAGGYTDTIIPRNARHSMRCCRR
jgi:molecular chaperone DnaK (HSP70)